MVDGSLPHTFEPTDIAGETSVSDDGTPIDGATGYAAGAPGDALRYRFPPGALANAEYLTADALLDGTTLVSFALEFQEGADGRTFRMRYGLLPNCEARIRIPLDIVDLDTFMYPREGAWLKQLVVGGRVDLNEVDRMTIEVLRMDDAAAPAQWFQTSFEATAEAPPTLDHPVLPDGPILDELGQSAVREWSGKTADAETMTSRLRDQHDAAAGREYPESFSEWGGWAERSFEATGFFRTEHDGDRWWLVDPDGHPFFSTGPTGVRPFVRTDRMGLDDALSWVPESEGEFTDAHMEWGDRSMVNYLAANLVRAFDPDSWRDRWAHIARGELRELGFNTIANWSDWEPVSDGDVPYVRPIRLSFPETPSLFRDFPDVFHPGFQKDAADLAEQLEETKEDSALIGYFLGNETHWSAAQESPAAGMLYATESTPARDELAEFLREEHGGDDALADTWGMDVSLADVTEGGWSRGQELTEAAREDLQAFSARMVERFYHILGEACRAVDPNHLNLGSRFPYWPAEWKTAGMEHVDVFSINCYQETPDAEYEELSDRLDIPVMIGEWHFGASDVGLPAAGIETVRDQEGRAAACRRYLETAASQPWCVGAHYFQFYDQSALGRNDGECYNIGFFDVCHRRYETLSEGVRRSNERLYDVAAGETQPFDEPPEYPPGLHL